MRLKFWGVRGSIPCPGSDYVRYGGNTSSLEVQTGSAEELILIDAGSGIRPLGDALQREPSSVKRVHLLLTHFHWDHIQGLPFFAPLFDATMEIILYAAADEPHIREHLQTQMRPPYFPVAFEQITAQLRLQTVVHGEGFRLCDVDVRPVMLQHPQGATGYRLQSSGGVLLHACDHEVGNEAVDSELRQAAKGASALVMDAQYTPEEYALRVGWGHSSYEHAAVFAEKAEVQRLILFHHDPLHPDTCLDDVLTRTKKLFSDTSMAMEGDIVEIR